MIAYYEYNDGLSLILEIPNANCNVNAFQSQISMMSSFKNPSKLNTASLSDFHKWF